MKRAQSLVASDTLIIKMCKIAAEGQGYQPKDIHGFVEMVPMGDAEIIRFNMRKNMRICNNTWLIHISSLLLLALIALLGSTALAATKSTANNLPYPPTSVDMKVKQITEHVYFVGGAAGMATDNEGFISNSGFVVTKEGVVVFDALGTPSLGHELIHKIRETTKQPIKKLVLSHYHADHIYGIQAFEELGVEIIAPLGAQEYMQSDAAKERLEERRFSLDPWVNEKTHLVLPDVTVTKSTTFELGGISFVINYMGRAHSTGDLTMLVENDKVLFSGDIIFEGRIPWVGSADSKFWLATLSKLETGGLAALIPGHGNASTNPKETIALTRKYLAYLRETMGAAVDEFTPFDEVYSATDWSAFKDLPAFEDANRKNAYQVYLSMEAELLQE